jgi:hypothetical protein
MENCTTELRVEALFLVLTTDSTAPNIEDLLPFTLEATEEVSETEAASPASKLLLLCIRCRLLSNNSGLNTPEVVSFVGVAKSRRCAALVSLTFNKELERTTISPELSNESPVSTANNRDAALFGVDAVPEPVGVLAIPGPGFDADAEEEEETDAGRECWIEKEAAPPLMRLGETAINGEDLGGPTLERPPPPLSVRPPRPPPPTAEAVVGVVLLLRDMPEVAGGALRTGGGGGVEDKEGESESTVGFPGEPSAASLDPTLKDAPKPPSTDEPASEPTKLPCRDPERANGVALQNKKTKQKLKVQFPN